jgi:hypothetical protein
MKPRTMKPSHGTSMIRRFSRFTAGEHVAKGAACLGDAQGSRIFPSGTAARYVSGSAVMPRQPRVAE